MAQRRQYSRGNYAPRLKEARNRAGLTQVELAEKAHVAIASIRRLESGEKKANDSTLHKLADSLKVSYGWLTGQS